MSIRCSGLASRSFIIGSRLWPPAMTRASGAEPLQRRDRALDAGRALVLEWRGGLHAWLLSDRRDGQPLAGLADVVALLVLHGGVGADHRRARQRSRAAPGGRSGIEQPRREAAALDVAQHRARPGWPSAIGASRPSRASVSVPLRVDLADARRRDRRRSPGSCGGRRRRRPGRGRRRGRRRPPCPAFLTSRPSSSVDAGVELRVDVVDDLVDRRALLEDLADAGDHLVEAAGDLAQLRGSSRRGSRRGRGRSARPRRS